MDNNKFGETIVLLRKDKNGNWYVADIKEGP